MGPEVDPVFLKRVLGRARWARADAETKVKG
jgi:hypothetical protein